ncbi:MAG: catalase, partial [bacterium]
VRGFSVKFYTNEGVFDLVGNNMPVFFIQDAIKFPDLIHAVKPEQDNEIPQAASAHDTFWDFISTMPESMHMIMWVMSDRAIPRSLRMMEGFGVHTFRLINEKNNSVFVKFHWKPLLGVHSVVWDEAQIISGKDSDFHRRDLWEAIESGSFPEWELGLQIVEEKDEFKFDFDLLDPTKLIPEELVPVRRIGKLTLNRNPDNFFAETEQVAFHPGHIVPGIDFSNDPLLQGRLFSYTDTQLSRLGSPNFHEIPINRSISPIHNNQRDGHMRQTINVGKTSYDPNTLNSGCPFQAKAIDGGFTSFAERIDARKIRARSKSFFDHFSQAKLFFNSQSAPEKDHIISALTFELGKLKADVIRKRMIGLLTQVDMDLAKRVATGLGMDVTKPEQPINHSIPADGNPKNFQPVFVKQTIEKSAALSMENTVKNSIKTRKIAILATDGVDDASLNSMKNTLVSAGAVTKIVASHLGSIKSKNGTAIKADESLLTTSPVLFDAVYIPGGKESIDAFFKCPETMDFVKLAYKHFKPIAVNGEGVALFKAACTVKSPDGKDINLSEEGVAINKTPNDFVKLIMKHRFWDRAL